MMDRIDALRFFYAALRRLGAGDSLAQFSDLRRTQVPKAGVYFLFEPGEVRSSSGDGPRVVRVGTHAITATSRTSLWDRLKQHRGNDKTLGGNHRGSIFRLLVGDALQRQDGYSVDSWGVGNNASAATRLEERALESSVSDYLRQMSVIGVSVSDRSERQILETNSIALLSNYQKEPLDRPSPDWLGHHSSREKVRESGLWNNRCVDASFDSSSLEILKRSTPIVRSS